MPRLPTELVQVAWRHKGVIRRWLGRWLVGVLCVVTACASPSRTPKAAKQPSRAAEVQLIGEAPCPRVNIATPRYGHTVFPRSGQVGDVLRITGTTLRNEGWRWATADRMEVWWNLRYSTNPERNSLLLARFAPGRACRFRVITTVPPARPGTYPINVIVYQEDFGPFLPTRFHLSDSRA
jgi:hypothetical protein